jgi:hypothetical protein
MQVMHVFETFFCVCKHTARAAHAGFASYGIT